MSLLKTVLIIGIIGAGIWLGYEYFIKPKAKDFLKDTIFPKIISLAEQDTKRKLTAEECESAINTLDLLPSFVAKGYITQRDADRFTAVVNSKCRSKKSRSGRIHNKCRLTPSDCIRMYGEDSQLIYDENGFCKCISENDLHRGLAKAFINEKRLLGISS